MAAIRAILEAARKPELVQMSLFAEPELPLDKQIEFYRLSLAVVK